MSNVTLDVQSTRRILSDTLVIYLVYKNLFGLNKFYLNFDLQKFVLKISKNLQRKRGRVLFFMNVIQTSVLLRQKYPVIVNLLKIWSL